jgi:hypothetical protein
VFARALVEVSSAMVIQYRPAGPMRCPSREASPAAAAPGRPPAGSPGLDDPHGGELLSSTVIRLDYPAEVTMVQRYPSSGKPVELERPPAPTSVVNAVKLMYAGAAVSTVSLIVSLADISGTKAAIRRARPNLTATQVNQLNTFIISLAIISGLLGIGLWLWMAWANNQGKNWARILSTVLFGLATLDLVGVFSQPKTLVGLVFPVLTWLVGLGAIWLLWRPDSTAFFKPQGFR